MYKTLGGYTWEGLYKEVVYEECSIDESPLPSTVLSADGEKTVAQSAQELQLAISSLKQVSFPGIHSWYFLCTSKASSINRIKVFQS